MRTVSPGILSCSSILAPDVNIRAVKDTTSALLPSSCSIYTIFPVPSDHLPTAVSSLQYHLKAFSFLHPSQQPLSGPGILPPSSCRSTHVHTWFPAFFIGELAYAREHRKPLWKTWCAESWRTWVPAEQSSLTQLSPGRYDCPAGLLAWRGEKLSVLRHADRVGLLTCGWAREVVQTVNLPLYISVFVIRLKDIPNCDIFSEDWQKLLNIFMHASCFISSFSKASRYLCMGERSWFS